MRDVPDYMRGVEIGPSPIHGLGVFARQHYQARNVIFEALSADPPPEGYWRHEDAPDHCITHLGDHVNHQNNPNAHLVEVGGGWYLVASRFIGEGEEITADYREAPSLLN